MKIPSKQIAGLLLALVASACGSDRGTAPADLSGWTELRFHEASSGPGGEFQDLSIGSDGRLVLTVGGGVGQSVRGLLAGEKLETLARLINALPPNSYAPASCEASYFLRVTDANGVRTYASGACDPATPSALLALTDRLSMVATGAREPRVQPVPYRVLLAGTKSAIHHPERHVARSQDELVALLNRHADHGSVAVPRVDFRTSMVVAEFAGDESAQSAVLSVGAVERTIEDGQAIEDGWLRIRWSESVTGPECGGSMSQPFVLISVPRQSGDLLFSSERVVAPCL